MRGVIFTPLIKTETLLKKLGRVLNIVTRIDVRASGKLKSARQKTDK